MWGKNKNPILNRLLQKHWTALWHLHTAFPLYWRKVMHVGVSGCVGSLQTLFRNFGVWSCCYCAESFGGKSFPFMVILTPNQRGKKAPIKAEQTRQIAPRLPFSSRWKPTAEIFLLTWACVCSRDQTAGSFVPALTSDRQLTRAVTLLNTGSGLFRGRDASPVSFRAPLWSEATKGFIKHRPVGSALRKTLVSSVKGGGHSRGRT